MTKPDPDLLKRAAACYERLGLLSEAARCHRDANSYRRAAELHERLGHYRDAALDYACAGDKDVAGWLLVHHVDDAAAARDQLGPSAVVARLARAAPMLRRRLVEARCDIAEGRRRRSSLAVLADVCLSLAAATERVDPYVEQWAICVAEAMNRDDQIALVFAAAVRGRRPGAEERWRTWMNEVLHSELVLPTQESVRLAGQR